MWQWEGWLYCVNIFERKGCHLNLRLLLYFILILIFRSRLRLRKYVNSLRSAVKKLSGGNSQKLLFIQCILYSMHLL